MESCEKNCLDSQLWHACAGGMVQMPPVNSKVFYFPQGHAEHTLTNVDFSMLPKIPALILCRVSAVKYLADLETDEVYAKIRLVPIGNNEPDFEDGVLGGSASETAEKPTSFAKTLTQSDANNGGGFSVPRYCAETIFQRLDYTADPPVQTVIAQDVHGETWKFRHIYRGTPRRHLLTTGWSTFVNQKKLIAGDSIVFLRADNGDLCVGIRRAKRCGMGGPETPSGWNTGAGSYSGFSAYLREDENRIKRSGTIGSPISSGSGGGFRDRGRVKPKSVIEAAYLAASGQPFEVVYYPRANTPEFCVRASSVNAAMSLQWCSGLRFKMAFETEDSSRISWFMGTISSVQVADPIHWPNSPWRLLQVTWDEPDLLQNVKHVSPWLVELVSNMPMIHLSPFSPPRKKLCLPQDLLLDGQFRIRSFSSNPLGASSHFCCLSDNISAGMQGARHAQFGGQFLDLHHRNKMQLVQLPPSFRQIDSESKVSDGIIKSQKEGNEDTSCLLTMGDSTQKTEKTDNAMTPLFLLFGQPIHTEQQISTRKNSRSEMQLQPERVHIYRKDIPENLSSPTFLANQACHVAELGQHTGHCKVILESEDVSHTLDLSVLGSYEELYKKLADMSGIERSEMLHRVIYRDATGALRQIGDEPFSEFKRNAKRLTISMNANSSNGRTWVTGFPTAERGLDSSNQAGALSIFA